MNQCLSRPTSIGLENQFRVFGQPGTPTRYPCKREIKNQCAVRMSVALCRAMGTDIFGSYPYETLVHSEDCCIDVNSRHEKVRHITSAKSLFNYLRNRLGFGFIEIKAPGIIQGKKGIIYFEKCYTRGNGRKGNHIDYWDGNRYTNSAQGINSGGNLRLFRKAEKVWFCQL